MKRAVKAILRAIWRLTAPVRRPLVRKLDHHMARLAEGVFHPHLGQIAARCEATDHLVRGLHHKADHYGEEINLVLNSVVREVARLEMQVEALQHLVQEMADARDDLSIVDQEGEAPDVPARRPEERMKVVG